MRYWQTRYYKVIIPRQCVVSVRLTICASGADDMRRLSLVSSLYWSTIYQNTSVAELNSLENLKLAIFRSVKKSNFSSVSKCVRICGLSSVFVGNDALITVSKIDWTVAAAADRGGNSQVTRCLGVVCHIICSICAGGLNGQKRTWRCCSEKDGGKS